MTNYAEFFLKSKSSVVQLETLEISHPDFTKVYRIVRNAVQGVTVALENSSLATFDYYPLKIENAGIRNDLDQSITINLGDLGEVLPKELDEVSSNNGFSTKPTVVYRTYRSDDLSRPLFGPVVLEVTTFAFNREGSSFEAKAPSLNITKTGEVYKIDRFPMLRGFL
ncbi:MAG: DUF1833 domain-containing protein [Alphaproteobacteria bacterium]|nr:DUF1833 domain-containing protein [Alphaproteobacteria bacterium]